MRLPHNHRSRFNPASASLAERSANRRTEKSVDFKLTTKDTEGKEAAIPPADNSEAVKANEVDISDVKKK